MKKKYIYPIINILPFSAVHALCVSDTPGKIGGGNDPEEQGRAPKRTVVF
jgi:hypothetical protein